MLSDTKTFQRKFLEILCNEQQSQDLLTLAVAALRTLGVVTPQSPVKPADGLPTPHEFEGVFSLFL